MRRVWGVLRGAGISLAVLAVALAALVAWPLPELPEEGQLGDVVIANVTVVAVEAGELIAARDVLIENGRIAAVAATGSIARPAGARIVDGTGRFVMPALWDMHTHTIKLAPQYQHPLMLANGVTGVRDMWGCMSEPDPFFACIDDRERWNRELAEQGGRSPRYIGQSSYQINGGSEVPAGFPSFFGARNANEARQLVAYYDEAGADFLKVYTELSPEAYAALSDEAHRRGLAVDGHRPIRVSLEAMIAAGQRSVEHGRVFLLECFAEADAFRALPDPLAAYTPELRRRLVDEHDEARCATLIDRLARSDTWWTPTLQTLRMGALAGDSIFRKDPRLRYIPGLFRTLMWEPDADAKAADSAGGRNVHAELYSLALEHVGLAHAAGAKLLTGTDAFDT